MRLTKLATSAMPAIRQEHRVHLGNEHRTRDRVLLAISQQVLGNCVPVPRLARRQGRCPQRSGERFAVPFRIISHDHASGVPSKAANNLCDRTYGVDWLGELSSGTTDSSLARSIPTQGGIRNGGRERPAGVLDWGGSGPSVVLLAGGGNTAHVF